ncbi:MAG: LysM peptidoglycan-binding domain-containing protein [Bryobacterales bacterium]|nr:LysM peptidoglycan-binding domain-containing protein [Bryobacterales bacterium]
MSASISLSIVSPAPAENVRVPIDEGGYRIKTAIQGGGLWDPVLLELLPGVFLDITGGYRFDHLFPLLNAISDMRGWASRLRCRAWLVEFDPNGHDGGNVYGAGPAYEHARSPHKRFRTLAKSGVAELRTPVEPYHGLLHHGRQALTQIGQGLPRIPYAWQMVDGQLRGDGRLLFRVGTEYYFVGWGKDKLGRGYNDLRRGSLETQADKRGLDCTTYLLSAYDAWQQYQGNRGDDVADSMGCVVPGPVDNQPPAEVAEFFQRNGSGEFVMWSQGHVVMVVNGVLHEYNRPPINGYRQMPIGDYLAGVPQNNRYSVAVMPGTASSQAPAGQGPGGGTKSPSGGGGGGTGGGGGGGGSAGGKTYTVVSGDSLSLLAGKFYDDVLLWPVIYDANKSVIGGNPNLIKPGQKFTIPSISGYSPSQLSALRERGRNWR